MDALITLAALLPILIVIVFMLILRIPAFKTMPVAYLATLGVSLLVWGMPLVVVAAASVKGFFSCIELMLIVIGALMLFEVMKRSGAIKRIDMLLSSITKDRRIQIIIIAFFFVSFIESIAGFGTPAALAAPLMVALGFSPISAVTLSLIGDSTPTSFGAAGTPLLIGMQKALDSPEYINLISRSGYTLNSLITETAVISALIHSIIAILMPWLIVLVFTGIFEKNIQAGLKLWKLAIFSGLCFSIPYFLTAYFIGPELPSIIGSVVGLAALIFVVKKGLFVPKDVYKLKHESEKEIKSEMPLWKALLPYAIVIILLLVTRIKELGLKDILQPITIGVKSIFSTEISFAFSILYSPGVYFIIAALIGMFVYKLNERTNIIKETIVDSWKPFVTLIFIIALVQIFINSGTNNLNLSSMPLALATALSRVGSSLYIFLAPLIGAFGSFIAGSNTVSNLMFSSLQASSAENLGIKLPLVLALQTIGGAIGNMICVFNIVAAFATVKLHDNEWIVIRYNLIPTLFYILSAGIIGYLMHIGIF